MNAPIINRLIVPSNHAALLEREGYVAVTQSDVRRFPRRYAVVNVTLQCRGGFPSLPRNDEVHAVKLIDISRGGIGFLHSEQLFPCERVAITIKGKKELVLEVQWCRRLGERCFQVGVKFT